MINSVESEEEVFSESNKNEIHRVACKVLKGTAKDNGMRLKDFLPKVGSELEGVPEYLVYRTVLEASRSDLSPIRSGGPWGGYYLDEAKVAVSKEALPEEEEPSVKAGRATLVEKDLYPLVSFWLEAKKECAFVSDHVARLRRGGQWSNPDVVALNPIDRLGFFDVEIISAEVKLSDANWRQFIFEAVSHRRYADRSYFVYRSPNGATTFDPEMFVYAEKFGVGIAIIDLPDNKVADLKKWGSLPEAEKLEFADSFLEMAPAPKDPVPIKEKCEFLSNIGIEHTDGLYSFGK